MARAKEWWKVSKISVANPDDEQEALVDADLDTLATALYVLSLIHI